MIQVAGRLQRSLAEPMHIDGLPLHIVQRGHNRSACFFDDQDRLAYLGWLRETLERKVPAFDSLES